MTNSGRGHFIYFARGEGKVVDGKQVDETRVHEGRARAHAGFRLMGAGAYRGRGRQGD
jgi:hypothetical protein